MDDDTDDIDGGEPLFPGGLDEFAAVLARRLADSEAAWRTCRDRRCVRARRCRDANVSCQKTAAPRECTEEEMALAMFELRAALDARMRESGG